MKSCMLLLGLTLVLSCQPSLPELSEAGNAHIRLNQVGYYPLAQKKFVVSGGEEAQQFSVVSTKGQQVVYEGKLSATEYWELSGENVQVGDFSQLTTPGEYAILVGGAGYSYPFEIKANVFQEAFLASVKALYYHRAGMAIEAAYGGIYAREAGHPDDDILYHPVLNRSGSVSAPKGWYDAGDYGKYVVNGAYSLGQLLVLVEQYPEVVGDGGLNLPESGNGLNDYLDEMKYEMDWLLTMQDTDGGVFAKLTAEGFEGMIPPKDAHKQRYLYPKATTATLDFAAAAAKFSRIIQPMDPAYAQTCLDAALQAWTWAEANPEVAFVNPEGTITGQYGDQDFSQEFFWAAAELYIATKQATFLKVLEESPVNFSFVPGESWANHLHHVGAFALIDQVPDSKIATQLRDSVLHLADELVALSQTNAYFQPIQDFHWGSNSDVLNTAFLLAQAYRLTQKADYLHTIHGLVDYVFGKNAVGYSFVSGFGDRTPQHLHHRPSASDGIAEPLPGFLSGGPNRYLHDSVYTDYPEELYQMTSWVDQEPSYASNEVCLNWNAPLTYVLGFLEQEAR